MLIPRFTTVLFGAVIIAGLLLAGRFAATGKVCPQPHSVTSAISSETWEASERRDPRVLVYTSDNVFIGRVLSEKKATRRDSKSPKTPFSVEVADNIKGRLSGKVTVVQQGGYEDFGCRLVLFDHDPLPIPRRTYLFATRLGEDGRYYLDTEYAKILIDSPADRDHLIEKFERAESQQIPPIRL
jgi:hypothetical protein